MKNSLKHILTKKERLKLSRRQRFWHYSIVFFLLAAPTMFVFRIFRNRYVGYTIGRGESELLTISLYFVLAAFLFYLIQYRRLTFRKMSIKLTSKEFKQLVEAVVLSSNWHILDQKSDSLIAISDRSWRSWGERITILNYQDEIWFNSICNPDGHPSVTSWGKNRKNYNHVLESLELRN